MNPWYNKAAKNQDGDRLSRRILTIGIFFALMFGAIGARAFHLHVFQSPWLSKVASNQVERSVDAREKRGTIYDSKHRELAMSIDVMSIAASPRRFEDAQSAAEALSQILDTDKASLLAKLNSERRFVWIKRHVTPREGERIQLLGLDGISFIPEHSRFYPNKALAAQLLGFTGIDGHGLEGLEYNFDRHLKGSGQRFTVVRDALGRRFMPGEFNLFDTRGNDVVLTIDQTVQYIAERTLEAGVNASDAETGIAIVMVPRTGEILALDNYPYFNPNTFSDFDQTRWRNRAVTDPFEPGSTLKLFTAAAALETGIARPETLFFAENGKYRIGRNTIHDEHPRAWISLTQIIQYSSNIGAAKLAEKIGPRTLYDTLTRFGFSEKTGIECPGETAGLLLPCRRWSRMDTSAIAFGQGISVSALQLVRAVSAIANDGYLMRPHILKAILDPNGGLVQRTQPETIRQVVSSETARDLRNMMTAVVSPEGTGRRAFLKGYRVCGKTGTAQKVDESKSYSEDKFTASFVGFAPAERPEIAIVVVIDEPKKGSYHGSVVAAPVFRRIALEVLDYMNVPPLRGPGGMNASYPLEITG